MLVRREPPAPEKGSPLTSNRTSILLAVLLFAPTAAHGQSPPPAPAGSPAAFTASDLWLGAAAVAGVLAVSAADRSLESRLGHAGGSGAQQLADVARPIGTPTVLAPAVLLGAAGGWVFGRPEVTRASVRIGVGICASAAACEVVKVAVGRWRPYQSPDDADELAPFSGHDSFPSGHTTVAFAAAAGLCRETSAPWVPWVAYPAAGLCGWSRIHDGMHWVSDVVAGAALGIWSANKTQDFLRRHEASSNHLSLEASAGATGERLALRWNY